VPAAAAEQTVAAMGEQALMPGLPGFNGIELALDLLHRIIAFSTAVLQVRQEIFQFAEIPGHVSCSSERQASEARGKGWEHTQGARLLDT